MSTNQLDTRENRVTLPTGKKFYFTVDSSYGKDDVEFIKRLMSLVLKSSATTAQQLSLEL